MFSELRDLSDDDLKEYYRQAEALITEREQERKKKAIAKIRDIAEGAGLKVDVTERGNVKTKNPPKYRNPDKLSQTWTGIGVKPKWFIGALESGKTENDLLIINQKSIP